MLQKNFPPNLTFLSTYLFVKDQKTLLLSEDNEKKNSGNSPATFGTHKHSASSSFNGAAKLWQSKISLSKVNKQYSFELHAAKPGDALFEILPVSILVR